MKREIIAALLLIAMAFGLYWKNQQHQQLVPFDSSLEPDFVAENLSSRTYDADGRLSAQISAQHMQHYQDAQRTEFNHPEYLIYPESGQGQWRVSAQQGNLQQGRFATLEQKVVITAILPGEPVRTLHTNLLQLDLETMEIQTDQPIQANGIDFTMQAIGLYGNLNTNHVEFLSEIEAIYEFN